MEEKHKHAIESSILLVPLFIAAFYMGYLVIDSWAPTPGVQFSPSKIDALVNALFAFIIIYAVILIFFFLKMNRKLDIEPTVIKIKPSKPVVAKTRKSAVKPKKKSAKKKTATKKKTKRKR